MNNYYAVLGVNPNASPDEIKRAYKKKVMQHHPDRGGDVKQFQQVQDAYEALLNPQKQQSHTKPPFNDFSQVFTQWNNQFNGFRSQSRARARLNLWINLEDLIDPTPRVVAVQGRSGVVNIEISIPPGIEDGSTVSYPRITPDGNDVLITFRVRPHSQFKREGLNLIKQVKLSVWDLILGTTTSIRNLKNHEIKVTVPPGTQPGAFMRVKGQGLPDRNGGSKGDILLHINTHIPEVSPDLIEQIKKHK